MMPSKEVTEIKPKRNTIPPDKFMPAENVIRAEFGIPPEYILKSLASTVVRSRSSQDGLRYEKKVIQLLQKQLPELVAGPWIKFVAGRIYQTRERWCQPDAFWADHDNKRVYVFEVKLSHTSNSWWQLQRLYIPVLRVIFPGYEFVPIEICKWYDPHTAFPVIFKLEPNIRDLALMSPQVFYVHIWGGTSLKTVESAPSD